MQPWNTLECALWQPFGLYDEKCMNLSKCELSLSEITPTAIQAELQTS